MRVSVCLAMIVAASCVYAADISAPGIRNFHKVNDFLFRGAQPSDEGFQSLARLGVKVVIDLRRPDEHSTELEKHAVEAAGMRYINEPMQGIVAPADEQIVRILAVLDSKEPVFVHCREGKDRTGTVIASYRMARNGWSSAAAMREANAHGMHWYEVGMKAFIRGYRAEADSLAAAQMSAGEGSDGVD